MAASSRVPGNEMKRNMHELQSESENQIFLRYSSTFPENRIAQECSPFSYPLLPYKEGVISDQFQKTRNRRKSSRSVFRAQVSFEVKKLCGSSSYTCLLACSWKNLYLVPTKIKQSHQTAAFSLCVLGRPWLLFRKTLAGFCDTWHEPTSNVAETFSFLRFI